MAKRSPRPEAVASPVAPWSFDAGPSRLGAVALALLAALVYSPALQGGFLLDDNVLLTDNALIRAGDGLWRIWFGTEAPDYWPLAHTSFWLEWRLWGLWSTGYHLTNLLLHVAEACLLWSVLSRLRIPGALLGALLFTLHPVNVEVVAWIAQRKTLLAFLFCELSLLCHLRGESGDHEPNEVSGEFPAQALWAGASLGFFALALLSKASVASFPLLLFCLLRWRGALKRRDWLVVGAMLGLSIAAIALNLWFRAATHGIGNPGRDAALAQRLLGAATVPWFYLSKAIAPLNLIFLYPEWTIEPGHWIWWLPLLAGIATPVALYRLPGDERRTLFWGWSAYCLSLLPVMGLADLGYRQPLLLADHYQHLALPVPLVIAAAALARAVALAVPRRRQITQAFVASLLVLASWLSWRQSGLYRDARTIYTATLEANPTSWLAHTNLGSVLFGAGEREAALAHYREAVRLRPDFTGSHHNLGLVLRRSGQTEAARAAFERAVELDPNHFEAQYALALSLAESGKNAEAVAALERSLALRPGFADAHYNLATTLLGLGRKGEAVRPLEEALRLQPDLVEAHFNLAGLLLESGRAAEAVPHYERILALQPHLPGVSANLGQVLLLLERPAEALPYLERASLETPSDADIHLALAQAWSRKGEPAKARRALEKALRVAPNHARARQALEDLDQPGIAAP